VSPGGDDDGLDSVRDVLQEYAAAFGRRVNLTVFDRGTGEVTRVEADPPGVNIDADPEPPRREDAPMGISDPLTFELTADHVTLLRHAYTGWQDCETGAPEVDPKRPYGNSYVPGDVAELLGWEPGDWEDGERVLGDRQVERALELHRETATALEVVLRAGSFEPGTYVTTDRYSRDWHRRHPPTFAPPRDEPPSNVTHLSTGIEGGFCGNIEPHGPHDDCDGA
jgi:hypothetical protein